MKLLCLTLCYFILKVRSQSDLRYNYPNYDYVPLSLNTDQIYFQDQFGRDSSGLAAQLVTTQNGNTKNRQPVEQQAIEVQSGGQRAANAPVSPNPANFNLWNREPDNVGKNVVNKSNPDLNRVPEQAVVNQASLSQNQTAANVGNLNQNPSNTQYETSPTGDLDMGVLNKQSGRTPASKIENQAQVPVNVKGLVGPSQNEATITFVNPKIDDIGPSVTHFGINLLKVLGDFNDGNTVISPLSISTCLALLQQGARGTTESQISNTLQLSPESSRIAYRSLTDEIKRRSFNNILRTANNIFVAKNFELNGDFSRIAQTEFGSVVSTLDYSQPIQAADEINKWVDAQTNHKITKLVSPEHVGPNTQMSVVNAVYFKGMWDITFNEAKTKLREFHLSNGQNKTVPFMRSRRYLRGGKDRESNATIINIPFKGDEYSLMWILPSKQSNLNDLIKALTAKQLLAYREFPSLEVDVEVPRFTIKTDSNLIPALRKMGISDLFGPYADLSRLGANKLDTLPLSVSSAVHSAVLSIDEHGGSAAGATSFGVVALSYDSPPKFKADKPFLVMLWDNQLDTPLFMAKILEPSENSL
ncbi:hypothetical protein K1T71_012256 [Dendrolimus kikuchii]|uniref:Uncharacterized protein n=1 Tax=Dendrolimus kikuchii TaxID=765133 RepID=A0ACC1CL27_9NEOP|nr:hypothetical protein K1T71_012256 [Dendrolimus kikuchii]